MTAHGLHFDQRCLQDSMVSSSHNNKDDDKSSFEARSAS